MSRKNIENIYALSPMQQGILFHALYAAEPGVYLVSIAWTLTGHLDTAAFARAWQTVCDRHAALRTAFAWEKLERPVQIVRKRVQLAIEQHDLRDLPPEERTARAAALTDEITHRSFDLTRAPLLRLALIRTDDETHRLVWCSHHLILDGWSLPVLVREAFTFYEAYAKGGDVRLPDPRPYGDYIAWLQKQDLARSEAYWRRDLAGFTAPTPLRIDRTSAPEEGFEERTLLVPEGEAAALQGFARAQQLTVNTLIVGAWALLLARYSGEEDVLYGNTVSGRSAPVPGIDRMVGMFINTLPVRVAAPRDATASAWLRSFQDKLAELREHEHSPLVEIQGWSEIERGVPLFESQVAFENYPSAETLLQGGGGLQVAETRMTSQAHYPLTFNAVSRRTIGLRISYDRRRFERAAVDRMLVHLRTLLTSLHTRPGDPIGALPILPDDERRRLLVTWNSVSGLPADTTVHRLFEEQHDADPTAPALVARAPDGGVERLSYGDLETRANRLAHRLRALGVGPDAVVGLCMDRSADLVIGLLGILKAGGAYLPLDPTYPPHRLAGLLEDAGARVVVTREAFAAAVAADGVRVIRTDADAAILAAESASRPEGGAGPASLAYVLFTSGSTGKPKGVAVEHRNVIHYLRGVAGALALPRGSRYAHVSTFSADLGNTVLFPPLCLGGTLHVIPEELTTDPAGLGAWFEREGTDCLKIVPSHLSALLSGAHPERVIPRKVLVLGGEGSTWELVERIHALAPEVRILNHYGPTETTVGVITHPVARGVRLAGTAILPLGRPLPGTRVYVLEPAPSTDPAPIGVPGELYVGGAGVTRGYLGQPELTRERFVPDPFGPPGGRLYRTGDRARVLDDGTILFLGRADHQVKIRGFRIELGEIEAALLAVGGIREAVVLVREDEPGDKRLAAFVVPAAMPGPTVHDIRAALEQRLPGYMVPPSIAVLEAMPITPNGKIDRRALLALGEARAEDDDTYVAPRSPIEEVIAGIWCDVFDRERVGVHDKFADLGGHSLLAIQIIARAREAFQVDVPLRAIFEAPTVAGLAAEVETAIREAEGTPAPPIERAPHDRPLRLSFAQERLWFLHQLDPQGAVYNVPSALRLRGKLDVPALERALATIVRRHEVLRTTFASEGGKPVQIVHPDGSLVLQRPASPSGPLWTEADARAEMAAEARRPFDLERGPLVRASLLPLGEEDHVLCVTLHHIVSDGWTRGILNRELGVLYRAFVAGREPELPELPVQYADYAEWQRRWLAGEVLDRQIAYWKKQLEGAPQALDLPTDRPRPAVQTYQGAQRIEVLPAKVQKGLVELSRREGVTLYMTLLSALSVLLYRWTGQRDVVVGTSVSNRSRAETERLIGFFINALVLRLDVDAEAPFTDLLARARDVCLGAYAHQDMPFERLVQELSPEPDPSRAPLFQVIFTMQNAPPPAVELPGLTIGGMRTGSATVKYDLTFVMGEVREGGLGLSIEYNTDLFDAATIDRMIGHLRTLLTGVADDARRKIRELPMLGDEERRLVALGNDAPAPDAEALVHELFEEHADASPDAIALVSGEAQLSFGELDRRANRLAHHLRARGVGAESVVGVSMGRSASIVVALLGILKAGGAYLPLDPAYPRRRLAELIRAAGARVVVTEDRFAPLFAESGAAVVRVDGDAAALAAESDARVESEAAPPNVAYVLFTSGSTGQSKGVAIEHRNLVSYVRAVAGRLALPPGSSYAHVSTFSADLGNTVLFPPLCLGGTLHVIAEDLTTDPAGLGAYFHERRVDALKIVPSHLSALLSGAHPERVLPHKLLVLGGEGTSWELIERLEKLAPEMRILNHYGPTETTVGVTTWPVERGARVAGTAIVPIGLPLPGAQVHVLDASFGPAPLGVPGEVYIGGAGVARGYLGQPELTRERFLADPFANRPGARLYKTGDRARRLPNGAIAFLGRTDFQIKIRGFRIELGEIEAALAAIPGIKDAVVLALGAPGDLRLVAYVVGEVPAADLATQLQERLPGPMIPSTFVHLPALPLTPNGKIDRRALALVEEPRGDDTAALHSAPRTPVEEVLASIWADVFERERIGIHDRFNELGGHSLLAIQIIARARDAFQTDIPLRAIFEAPTVAALAERIEASIREGSDGAEGAPPPLVRAPRLGAMPLSFAQERLWFLHQLDPADTSYNIPTRLRIEGPLDTGALEDALRAIVARHEVLRTTFATAGGTPAQVIHDASDLRLAVEDVAGEEAARAAAAREMSTPFDLSKGPLLRAKLLRLAPDDHVLLLTLHHIVSDAWTKGVLFRELAVAYGDLCAGRAPSLPPLPVQYADYAAWQRGWLSGEALDRQLAYWKQQLASAPASLDLPPDRPRPPVFTGREARTRFSIPAEVGSGLRALARREGATLFMTLLAAFDVLLHRYTGQDDLAVGTPIAGRARPELEPLIGFFVNTLAIRARVRAEASFLDLIAEVREACLGAYAHQDLPFERLVTSLAPGRDLGRTPLFQVVFTLQDAGERAGLRLPGLRVSGMEGETVTSKFDLTLSLGDVPGGDGRLLGSLEYCTDLFDRATAERMAGHYAVLLGAIAAGPEKKLWELNLAGDDERRMLLGPWSERHTDYPRDATIHALFAAQAAATPEATAVVFGNERLTYRGLSSRANRLAHRLRALGVGPGTRVGLYARRSIEMVVATLAILKAGGAYVPLDPEMPDARLTWMREDAGAALVVLAGTSPAGEALAGAKLVDLAAEAARIEAEPDTEPAPGEGSGESLAYVMYTSGSTGKPKGVCVPHRGVVRLVRGTDYARFAPDEVFLQLAPIAFDAATFEIWGALLNGGTLAVFPAEPPSPTLLGEVIRAHGVTALWLTAGLFNAVIDAAPEALRPLRQLLTGGDALSVPHVQKALAALPGVRLINGYGPTEGTTFTCCHTITSAEGVASIPIGRPIANTTVHVLDDHLAPVPIGVPGELYAGGDGLAHGYLNRPDLDAERFVPDPFSRAPGARLYRTGDRVRWLADGTLAFLGRRDLQVKLRGYRIELGEIEAALLQHPAVRQAVVVARADAAGEKRLCAYLVCNEGEAPTVDELRAFLVAKGLLDAMVPSAFVLLDALPLTENGKVDRRALPAPEEAEALALGEAFAPPESAVEQALATIWASVLRLPRVSIHDNFFALGGDSILSIQIVSRAQAAGIHLTPRQLFQHQTIAELAAVAGRGAKAEAEQGPVVGPVPLTPIERWWLADDPAEPHHYNQSYFLETAERLEAPAVEGAIAALLFHHDALRLRMTKGAAGWEQAIAEPGGAVPLTCVALAEVPAPERAAAVARAAAEAQQGLDLARGPILRAVLFDQGEGQPSKLLLVIHHIGVDAVSWRILIDDLWTAYDACRRGASGPAPLPAKTTSFKRWAERLVEHAASDALTRESGYWQALGTRAIQRVPVDHDAGENTEASARTVVVSLSAAETEALLREVPAAYRTQINDPLLTAFAQAFRAWSGAEGAVLVDLEGHGREEIFADVDLARTVGWFTAVFPVLLDPGAGAGPGEALKAVKEQLRAVPDRGVGYGILRYLRSGGGSALPAAPEAEVSFNYLGQLDQRQDEGARYRRAREPAGSPHGPRNRRRHLIDVTAAVADGALGVRFAYSENRHARASIERLAASFLEALRAIVAHCTSPGAGGYTPSDFALAGLGQAAIDRIAARAGGRGSIEDLYPLSPMQQGILFHALYAQEPGVYFVQLAWTITGKLDVPAFVRAFQDVVDRHPALRTAILWEGLDRPLQLVHARAALPFAEHDLSDLGPEAQEAAILRFAEDDRRRGFDLGQAPLMRIALLRLGEDRRRFVWSFHHIMLDGWSMPILLKEALDLYEARARGVQAVLAPVQPYGAYIGWLCRQDPAAAMAFWQGRLAGFAAPTPLAGEDARPEGRREERYEEVRLRLADGPSAELSAFARKHRLTMSTLVQGAWAILLARYSGEEDVVFGATASGRSAPVPGIDRMVGLFINTLAVRVAVRPDDTALAFFEALQEREAEMRVFEHTALAEVQALSAVPRGTPLFESLVVFENQPVDEALQKGGGTISLSAARAVERPAYPIVLQSSFRKALLLRIGFDAARFDTARIERMLGHIATLLERAARAPERPLHALPILTPAERHKLLVTWNDTAFAHPTDRLMHELVEDQAARTPEAVALVFEGKTLRYGEFSARANQLAHALRKRGVGPGALVAVCMERSLELLIALHAVLRAGGAYVPLDPEHPRDRLAFMLDDLATGGLAAILTQAHLEGVLADVPTHGAPVIRVDADEQSLLAGEPATSPGRGGLTIDDLAYVIYTSGSTGRPKGARNTHRGILNRLLWVQHTHPILVSDALLQKTPFSFDVSVWELFWPLMFGARLVIARPGGHRAPDYIADTVAAQGVTTIHFVPSMLGVFLDEPGLDRRCRTVRRVFASGEALPPALADRLLATLPGIELHNLYGPTETAIEVTAWTCPPGAPIVPIGRPIHNTRIYLLDANLEPVPEGMRGELYIGGVQVGPGYLNRPELTAERFVRDPFAGEGARLYRTGDVARHLPSGDVEYLGRADFQVKIRGFRIELGEIEAALVAHPAVREAVVVAREDGGGKRLVGYLVCPDEPRPKVGELQAFLRETLPDYMVPAAFVLLDALPLTSSGKIDRRALPAPGDADRPEPTAAYVAPSGVVEEALCQIWAQVLRLPRVGVQDNFFEVGGDSILSIQIVSRAAQAGIHVTPRQIFEHPTVAQLAAVAGPAQGVPATEEPVAGSDLRNAGLSQEELDMLADLVADD